MGERGWQLPGFDGMREGSLTFMLAIGIERVGLPESFVGMVVRAAGPRSNCCFGLVPSQD